MNLRFVQKFGEHCRITRMLCDNCMSMATATFCDETNKAYTLCEKHRIEIGAPEPTPGIEYASTMVLLGNWRMVNGVPTND